MVKRLPTMRETRVQSLGQEDPRGEGNGNPLQYSCLENPMDRGAWLATVHGVAKSRTRLSAVHGVAKHWTRLSTRALNSWWGVAWSFCRSFRFPKSYHNSFCLSLFIKESEYAEHCVRKKEREENSLPKFKLMLEVTGNFLAHSEERHPVICFG